jgi:hypothetical protein
MKADWAVAEELVSPAWGDVHFRFGGARGRSVI